MKDRVPTQVLENGAVRMEQFDASGNSLGYLWLKRADAPSEEGTPLCKSTLLSDETKRKIPGIRQADDPTVNDALRNLGGRTIVELYKAELAAGGTAIVSLHATLGQYAAMYLNADGAKVSLSVGTTAGSTTILTTAALTTNPTIVVADNGFLVLNVNAAAAPRFVRFVNPGITSITIKNASAEAQTVRLYGLFRGDAA